MKMKRIAAVILVIVALWPLGQIRLALSSAAFGWNLFQTLLILLLVGAARELWKGKKDFKSRQTEHQPRYSNRATGEVEMFPPRIGRLEFFTWKLAALLLWVVALVPCLLLFGSDKDSQTLGFLVLSLTIGTLIGYWVLFVPRRLHDLDHDGWMALLLLIPGVGFVVGLWLLFAKGTSGENRFGTPTPNRSAFAILFKFLIGKKEAQAPSRAVWQHIPRRNDDNKPAPTATALPLSDGQLLFIHEYGDEPGAITVRVVRVGGDYYHMKERGETLSGRTFDPEVSLIGKAEAKRLGLEMGYDLDVVAAKTK